MSRANLMLVAAILLAGIAVAVNMRDPKHSVTTALEEKPEVKGSPPQAIIPKQSAPAKPVKPVGSKDAKVVIKVLAQSGNPCHSATFTIPTKIAEAVPQRVRVEFLDTGTEEGAKASSAAGISCEAGMLVNDKNQFNVRVQGKKVHVAFHGPIGMDVPDKYFRAAIEQELKKQYADGLTEKERKSLDATWKALPKLIAEGESGSMQGAGKGHGHPPGKPEDNRGKVKMGPALEPQGQQELDEVLTDIVKSAKDGKSPAPAKPRPKGSG